MSQEENLAGIPLDIELHGRICLVTGASSGLGLETATGLARAGGDLILVCRDSHRGEQARDWIAKQSPGTHVGLFLANFESLDSVHALSKNVLTAYPAVHVLINNAGTVNKIWRRTADGFEATWQVNHLAPFLLTNLLLDRLIASAPARVVTVASASHKGASIDFRNLDAHQGYSMMKAYGQSKLANILFAFELAHRLKGQGVTSNCLHPGMVATRIGDKGGFVGLAWGVMKSYMLTPAQGVETILYLAGSQEVADTTGAYFKNKRIAQPDPIAYNQALQKRLWEVSTRMSGLPSIPSGSPSHDVATADWADLSEGSGPSRNAYRGTARRLLRSLSKLLRQKKKRGKHFVRDREHP
jgi:NAD(P)-dependent dehydrogenase (short-subunit alcohol dehydrogenase family)